MPKGRVRFVDKARTGFEQTEGGFLLKKRLQRYAKRLDRCLILFERRGTIKFSSLLYILGISIEENGRTFGVWSKNILQWWQVIDG